MSTVSKDRINIVLPAEDRALADAIAEKLGMGHGGRSAAIRYALRQVAWNLGIPPPEEKRSKKRL